MAKRFSKNGGTYLNLIVIGGASILLWVVLTLGQKLNRLPISDEISRTDQNLLNSFFNGLQVHNSLSILILQILIIIVVSRALGWLMSLINQPTVIGEILAGIAMGPSLLGIYFPDASQFLFPTESLGNLEMLSQIGLIMFMFIIGMELDINVIRKRAGSAIFISNVSILFPFILGSFLSLYLYKSFAPENTRFLPFALFIGIAMSITAFPVLARIVQERGLSQTPLGMTAITCAAIDDITAWSVLALVVAIAKASAIISGVATITLSIIYLIFMLFIIKPLLNKIAIKYTVKETISKTLVAFVLGIMLISAWITETIGIHALFGAFMAGVIIPDNARFKHIMSEKIEDVSLVLLLPLFFVYTGLRTQIGLLNEPGLWLTALLVISVAITGKFAGGAFAARISGHKWKDSLLLGTLMNTRGLIELVALNIGYDIGVLSPEIFTIFVLVALVTTFMTGPLMAFINYLMPSDETEVISSGTLKVLVAFGPPEAGGKLTSLVYRLFGNNSKGLKISALHLTPNTEISIKNAKQYEDEAFSEVKKVAYEFGTDIKTIYRTAENVSAEITKTANRGKYDLLLVGSSRPLLSQDETGGRARHFFENARCTVGLLIDKGTDTLSKILIITESGDERFLYEIAKRFNPGCSIESACVLPPSVPVNGAEVQVLRQLSAADNPESYSKYDLIVTTPECYRDQRDAGAAWVDGNTSVLLISR